MKRYSLCLLLSLLILSCDKKDDPISYEGLILNELFLHAGTSWVEVFNISDTSIQIAGVEIQQKGSSTVTLFKVPDNTTIGAKERKVFTLTTGVSTKQSPQLLLVDPKQNILDSFDRDAMVGKDMSLPDKASYSRIPDIEGDWMLTLTSTNGASNVNGLSNQNGIWLRGGDLMRVDFAALAANGVGNIFLNEYAFAENNSEEVKKRINEALTNGIKTHIWMQCFYANGSWLNPINVSTKEFNQTLFNSIIEKGKTYARLGVGGIHLDYLRYPGTAHLHVYPNDVTGINAITEFTKQLTTAVKAIDNDLVVSAAVMWETTSIAYYYGQSTKDLGKYLDVIIPMIYRYSYNADRGAGWISNTARWFAENSAEADVWGGVLTYKPLNESESQISTLTKEQLLIDCKALAGTGAKGAVLFRWGIVNMCDLSEINF